jgi:hypothetical protein
MVRGRLRAGRGRRASCAPSIAVALLLAASTGGCRHAHHGAPTAPAIRARALSTFERAWAASLPKMPPRQSKWVAVVDALLRRGDARFTFWTQSCRAYSETIRHNDPGFAESTLAGDNASLDRDGDCVEVGAGDGRMADVIAILDERADIVLFLCLSMEG